MTALPRAAFDYVFCHNALEYIENQQETVALLSRTLKPGGTLSVVKHNHAGKVFQAASFADAPADALDALTRVRDRANSVYFGPINMYTNEWLAAWTEPLGLYTRATLGIRAFYALSGNNAIKYDAAWYDDMFRLELAAAALEPYRSVAFFNHVLLTLTSA